MVESVAIGGVGRLDSIDPRLIAPFDRGVLGNGGGVSAIILGRSLPEANPHGKDQAHEGANKSSLEK